MNTDRSQQSGLLQLMAGVLNLLGQLPDSVLLLGCRLAAGAIFFKSALTKIDTETWVIAPTETTIGLFRDEYHVPVLPPEIAAYLGTYNEFFMPFLLVLGLGARLGAAALLGMTFVIQVFVYPENWAEHLSWAVLLAFVLTRGPGQFSVDHLLAGRFFERQLRYAR